MNEHPRIGRPISAKPGRRAALGLRVMPETKAKIVAAAIASGRSLSLECEIRLEQSMADDRVLAAIADLTRRIEALERRLP